MKPDPPKTVATLRVAMPNPPMCYCNCLICARRAMLNA
jgi:hypothetical protein